MDTTTTTGVGTLPNRTAWTHEQMVAIRKRADGIDPSNTLGIMTFAAASQSQLQMISARMLSQVRATQGQAAGTVLGDMVFALKGFTITAHDARSLPTFWERVLHLSTPLAKLMMRFDGMRNHIDSITDTLLHHEHAILQNVHSLEALHTETLAHCEGLDIDIAAGSLKISDIDTVDLPLLRAQEQAAHPDQAALLLERIRALESARDSLSRRVHDLRITRQVALQTLAALRILQDNDRLLAERIATTLSTTLPLWEQQLAKALTLQTTQTALHATQEAIAHTQTTLQASTDALQASNTAVRADMARGVFDVQTIQEAHDRLIKAIEDSANLAQHTARQRAATEASVSALETHAKTALARAKAHAHKGA